MNVEIKDDFILFLSEENTFDEFIEYFTNQHTKFAENNIIIYLSSKLTLDEKHVSLFLKYADHHQDNGTTFVIVYSNIDVDSFPESFNIVPTLQEAEDVLEMENIQRDLGF